VPLFTIGGIVVTQAWNTLAERARRRAERAARWDPERGRTFQATIESCSRLLGTPVWPARPGDAAAPVRPLADAVAGLNHTVSWTADRTVATAANRATNAANDLATAIEDLRAAGPRPAGGALGQDDLARVLRLRAALTEAVDQFAVEARASLGITGPYAAPWRQPLPQERQQPG
jgi:hypothetical protein